MGGFLVYWKHPLKTNARCLQLWIAVKPGTEFILQRRADIPASVYHRGTGLCETLMPLEDTVREKYTLSWTNGEQDVL